MLRRSSTMKSRTVYRRLCVIVATLLLVVPFYGSNRLKRTFFPTHKVTIVITSTGESEARTNWLLKTLKIYSSEEYAEYIDQVILVWNSIEFLPTELESSSSKIKVVGTGVNSLNNRWTLPLHHISTRAVLNLDDDVWIDKAAIFSMFQTWRQYPDRLIGPFVRQYLNGKYHIDELVSVSDQPFQLILPRVMMLSTTVMASYGKSNYKLLREYVDDQDAHCDDIALNAIAQDHLKYRLLRILLPPGSVRDYSSICGYLDVGKTSGLADQTDRAALRTECSGHIETLFRQSPFQSYTDVIKYNVLGGAQSKRNATIKEWRAMAGETSDSLCPELDLFRNEDERIESETAGSSATEELRMYCPENSQTMLSWIDSISQGGVCDNESDLEHDAFVESARSQCGAWCVWDLRRSGPTGWHYTGDCFERHDPFLDEHDCSQWFFQRPAVLLPS